jgi:hypothetical protein
MRRREFMAAGLAVTACSEGPARPARAATPAGDQPGNILTLEGTGAPAGTVVPFAYAFPEGFLPRGGTLLCRRRDTGAALPGQCEVKASWPDGSARHALLALAAPALPAGRTLQVEFQPRAEAPAAEPPLRLAAALAGRSAVVEITPETEAGPGTPWRCDLVALLGRAAPWREGPLAAEARIVVPVPPEALGTGVTEVGTATRGAAADGRDPLPHRRVLRVARVNAGGTFVERFGSFRGGANYVPGMNWNLLPDSLSWAPRGPEPAAGTSYSVVYTRPGPPGRITTMRLVADLMLLADGSLWCDLALRNDVVLREGGDTATYAVRLLLDGAEALKETGLAHGLFQAFVRQRGVRAGGGAAPERPVVRPEVDWLADAGAVHRYDARLGAHPDRKRFYAELPARHGWNLPFDGRGFQMAMPTTGGRWDIGTVTEPQAIWLMSGERAIQRVCLDQSEAMAGVPWHFWDPEGGADGRGGWLDPRRQPARWADPGNNRDPGFRPMIPLDTGWIADTAHAPAGHYVPYLLTGRRSCLDGVQAQASFAVMASAPQPAYRGRGFNPATGEGMNVVRNQQVRAGAWSLRALVDAAYVSPPDDPNGTLWRDCVAGNLAWMVAQAPGWTERQGEAHGYFLFPSDPPQPRLMDPWMNDFMVTSLWRAARSGFPDALRVLGWMKTWAIGRFLQEERGFPPIDGTTYHLVIGAEGRFLRSWAAIAAATREAGESNATRPNGRPGYFGRYGWASVALYRELMPEDAEVQAAWRIVSDAQMQRLLQMRPADFQREANQSIVPRGMTRAG